MGRLGAGSQVVCEAQWKARRLAPVQYKEEKTTDWMSRSRLVVWLLKLDGSCLTELVVWGRSGYDVLTQSLHAFP